MTPCTHVVAHICGLYFALGVQPGGMARWLLDEQFRSARDKRAQGERAASELEMERRNILNAMRYREPERGGLGPWTSASPFNPKPSQSAVIMTPFDQSVMTFHQIKMFSCVINS